MIDDLVDKFCGKLDNVRAYKDLYDLYLCLSQRIDMFYEIFVTYNIPYSVNLNAISGMGWPAFKDFGTDIGYEGGEAALAHIFYISGSTSKQISSKIAGETLENQQMWCLQRIERNIELGVFNKLNFSGFIESIVRLASTSTVSSQKLHRVVIGYFEK